MDELQGEWQALSKELSWLKRPQDMLRQAQIWLRDRPMRELGSYLRQYDFSLPALRMSGAAAVRAFWEVAQNHPDERIYQSPYYWAAFTFTGV